MKTKSRTRVGHLTGLLLAVVVVLATMAQIAQAASVADSGASGTATHPKGGSGTTLTVQQVVSAQRHGLSVSYAPVTTGDLTPAETPSTGVSATVWIVVAAAVGALLVASWVILERRRRRHAAAPGCESTLAGC